MYKIAAMGDRDSIYGFSAIGLDIYPVDDVATAGRTLRNLVDDGYAVIYVTEALCPHIERELTLYRESMLPAIISIPGVFGNTNYGMAQVRKSVLQAVGSDIIFGEQG